MQYLVKPFEQADLADRLRQVAAALGVLADGETDQAAIDQAFGAVASARTPSATAPREG